MVPVPVPHFHTIEIAADLNKEAPMATAASIPVPRVARFPMRLAPTLPDLFFAILLAAWFGQPAVWQGLLGDGDTGWHIRTGEILLGSGHVPARDPFSFWRAGERRYAGEWLSGAIFAEFHRWRGLEAVAALAVVVVCLWAAVLFAWLLDRGAGAWISLGVTLGAVSASSIHFLARPHRGARPLQRHRRARGTPARRRRRRRRCAYRRVGERSRGPGVGSRDRKASCRE